MLWILATGYYSARSASIGSMRVAWRAGSHVAINATNPRPAVTAT